MTTIKTLGNDGRSWYEINGTDYGTEYEFNADVFGVCDDGTIVDSDGCPLVEGNPVTIAVHNSLKKL